MRLQHLSMARYDTLAYTACVQPLPDGPHSEEIYAEHVRVVCAHRLAQAQH